jgi:uncharacterized cupredoxin-like copper-binding protein
MGENAGVLRPVMLVAFGLLLAACGGGSEKKTTTTAPEVGTVVGGVRVLKTFVVHETEYALKPSKITVDRLAYYAIKAVNDGHETHALEVKGHGVDAKSNEIAPGESATFAVDLTRSGKYRLFCPVDDHAGKGMEGTITVP